MGCLIWSALFLLASANSSPVGWRAASTRSPRLTYRYQDLPICEMGRAATQKSEQTGLIERWWNGGAPVTVNTIDLESEKPITEICVERLSRRDVEELNALIEADFWYSYLTPSGEEARVSLGFMNETKPMIYAHKTFHTFGDDLYYVVPSAPIPLKSEHDLRLSYDVISHEGVSRHNLPSPMLNQLIWYNAICTTLIITLIYFAFRSEVFAPRAAANSGYVNVALSNDKFELMTVALGSGSQLFATLIFLPIIVFTSNSTYSIYKTLISYTLGYVANGFMVIRLFRTYRSESNLFRTVLCSLLLGPLLMLLCVWHLNLLLTEVGSSRAIPMLRFSFKFLVFTLLLCTPLHYAGAVLSYRYTAKGPTPIVDKDSERKSGDYTSLTFGLIPFGSIVLCLSQFIEILFGPRYENFASPSAFLIAVCTYTAVVGSTTIAAARLNSNEDWTTVPIGLAAGTSLSTTAWLIYLTFSRYLLSASTVVELLTYSVYLGLGSGLVTLVVSYLVCEVYYSRFGAEFLTKPQF